jgi:hypothetical protein
MDDAIELMREFIHKEHEAALALYGEPDEAVFEQKVQAVRGLLDPTELIEIQLTRAKPAGKAWFRQSRDNLASTAPRQLFMVKRYKNPKLGDLFEGYVGVRYNYPKQAYAAALFAAPTGGRLAVVALYTFCRACRGTSASGGERCAECESTGWAVKSGADVEPLGQLVETRKLTPPNEPGSLADYEKS